MNLFEKIAPPTNGGTRWVIPDIHGFKQTLVGIVANLQLKPQDQLFFLGDYISRGTDSAGVLDFILDLQTQRLQVFCLRGNHEEMFLEDWDYYKNVKTLKDYSTFITAAEAYNNEALLDKNGKLITKYEYFLKDLPYYFDVGDFYLVHAGFDFSGQDYLNDTENMVWVRRFPQLDIARIPFQDKRIVVGHSVVKLSLIRERIAQKHRIIPLDNGAYYHQIYKNELEFLVGQEVGNLCAFNLDTWALVVQPCLD
jgi:serine/threonine protein phosphatase 1